MLLKIELSEITPFFYNFFGFGGGDFPSFPPGYALAGNVGQVSTQLANLGVSVSRPHKIAIFQNNFICVKNYQKIYETYLKSYFSIDIFRLKLYFSIDICGNLWKLLCRLGYSQLTIQSRVTSLKLAWLSLISTEKLYGTYWFISILKCSIFSFFGKKLSFSVWRFFKSRNKKIR